MDLVLFLILIWAVDWAGTRLKHLEEENESLQRRLHKLEDRFPESDGK